MHLLIVRAERDRDRSWLACAVGSCSEQHVDGVEWSLLRGTASINGSLLTTLDSSDSAEAL